MSRLFLDYLKPFGLLFVAAVSLSVAAAQQGPIGSLRNSSPALHAVDLLGEAPAPPVLRRSPERVIADLVTVETKVREALNHHTFKRDVVLQTIGPNGEVTGEYVRNSQFIFDDRGNRIERVTYHPQSTIREMRITREDIQDLAGAQLLGIDAFEPNKYQLTFAGRETLNARDTYAIDVAPRQAPDPHRMSERFFVGRVWIDLKDLQIVKVRGVVEPHGKQRFPIFETWREQAGTPFLFPTRTEADDVLHFPSRDVHYRIKVRYYDYKRFASKVSVTEVDSPSIN
jgi:hypothetical protein